MSDVLLAALDMDYERSLGDWSDSMIPKISAFIEVSIPRVYSNEVPNANINTTTL